MRNQELRHLLASVRARCGCESYYSYQCYMCKCIGKGLMQEAEVKPLVRYTGEYTPYELTDAGKAKLKELEENVC